MLSGHEMASAGLSCLGFENKLSFFFLEVNMLEHRRMDHRRRLITQLAQSEIMY